MDNALEVFHIISIDYSVKVSIRLLMDNALEELRGKT